VNDLFQPALLNVPRKARASSAVFNPKEFKLLALRECPTPAEMQLCDTPDKAAAYWWQNVPAHPFARPWPVSGFQPPGQGKTPGHWLPALVTF
jgi:hypothetical protein